MTGEEDPVITIAMHPALVPAFKKWLAGRSLHLAGPIPATINEVDVGDDCSFYIVSPTNDHPAMRPSQLSDTLRVMD